MLYSTLLLYSIYCPFSFLLLLYNIITFLTPFSFYLYLSSLLFPPSLYLSIYIPQSWFNANDNNDNVIDNEMMGRWGGYGTPPPLRDDRKKYCYLLPYWFLVLILHGLCTITSPGRESSWIYTSKNLKIKYLTKNGSMVVPIMWQPIVMQDKINFLLTTPEASPRTAGTVTRHIGLAGGSLRPRENKE